MILPGAPAVRTLTRNALVVLIPMAIGVGLFVEWLRSIGRIYRAPLLIVVMVTEQLTNCPTSDIQQAMARSERIAREIPEGCPSFLYSLRLTEGAEAPPAYVVQLDAMWAGNLGRHSQRR